MIGTATRMLLFIVLALAGSSAQAVLVTWTLHNVTFSDGGTASGFVTFDPAARNDSHRVDPSFLTDFDIKTTAGTVFTQAFEYNPANTDASNPDYVHFFSAAGTTPRHGLPQRWLNLQAFGGFPAQGGLIQIFADASGETFIGDAPGYLISSRQITGGFMSGVLVPEPARPLLFAIGLVLLGLVCRTRAR